MVSPLTVTLDSSDTAVPALCLGSYMPILADRVSVTRQGSQLMVLGVQTPRTLETFAGTPLWGTYDATKPIRHFLVRKVGTSDASGYATASTIPSGATVILSATTGMNLVTGHTILLRTDITLPATATFQLRNSATPYALLAATAYDFNHDIAYQV